MVTTMVMETEKETEKAKEMEMVKVTEAVPG